MKMKTNRLIMVLAAVAGVLTSSAFAELGLAGLATGPGSTSPEGVYTSGTALAGLAVWNEAKSIFANNTDPAVIQAALVEILNEAELTGNEQVMRYAIVAIMVAGKTANIDLCKAAVDGSNIYVNYKPLATQTVAQTKMLMTASGKSQDRSVTGNEDKGGDKGKDDASSGGGTGTNPLLDVDPFFRLLVADFPATPF